ncbi:MAG: anthranilate phosphoribosyltransferase, partial [Sulfurovum sp.]|nr:anthranilate phosphoribosyltransferase [Sulfurovum sp.]
ENGRISEGEVNPETFGFQKASKEAILGGDAQFNAQITHDIFNMKELGPKRDIVLLNTAYALFADGNTRDIQEAVEKAKAAIESGKAAVYLKKIAKVSQKLTL